MSEIESEPLLGTLEDVEVTASLGTQPREVAIQLPILEAMSIILGWFAACVGAIEVSGERKVALRCISVNAIG